MQGLAALAGAYARLIVAAGGGTLGLFTAIRRLRESFHRMAPALEARGIHTRVISAIRMDEVAEPYIRRRAVRHLEKKRICIFAAGTGNPYFTTDTAATLRASEMNCEAIFKGTKVDGVYDKDPKKHADAVRYDNVTYDEVLQKHLGVMDASAIALARDNDLPIIVFSLDEPGGFRSILNGTGTSTRVHG